MAKLYLKKGNISSEEKKYIKQLEKFMSSSPETEIKPAKNFSQLKKLYEKHCVETVDFEETEKTDGDRELDRILEEQQKEKGSSLNDDEPIENDSDIKDDSTNDYESNVDKTDFIDPFNKEEPIIRDHVLSEGFSREKDKIENAQTQSSFSEPSNFKDSFEIPKDVDGNNFDGSKDPKQKTEKVKSEPLNPEFNNLNTSYRNRKTKRMAKNIVNVFCYLLENGVPKWATRDITPEALAASVKNNELNLDVIFSFDGQTQIHIVEYFKQMCETAKELGKIPEELKEDLRDDLYDLLIEKGITPSPIQGLLLTLGEIVVLVGVKTYGFRLQVNAVKDIAVIQKTEDQTHEEIKETFTPPESHTEPEKKTEPVIKKQTSVRNRKKTHKPKSTKEGDYSSMKQIGDETKE